LLLQLGIVIGIRVNVNAMAKMPTENRSVGCYHVSFQSNGTCGMINWGLKVDILETRVAWLTLECLYCLGFVSSLVLGVHRNETKDQKVERGSNDGESEKDEDQREYDILRSSIERVVLLQRDHVPESNCRQSYETAGEDLGIRIDTQGAPDGTDPTLTNKLNRNISSFQILKKLQPHRQWLDWTMWLPHKLSLLPLLSSCDSLVISSRSVLQSCNGMKEEKED
jgi:hypothetical protein